MQRQIRFADPPFPQVHAQAEETNARLAALHVRHEAALDLERAQHGARDRVSEQVRCGALGSSSGVLGSFSVFLGSVTVSVAL